MSSDSPSRYQRRPEMDVTIGGPDPLVRETERTGEIVLLRARGDVSVDAQRLAEALAAETSAEVRFDDGHRAVYAHDGSNYRQVPIGVVIPRSTDDVMRVLAVCRGFGAPLLS